MRQFRALAWLQLRGLLAITGNRNTRRQRAWSAWAMLGAFALVGVMVGSIYSFSLMIVLGRSGNQDLILGLIPALGALVAVLVGAQASGSFVFGGRDNDLLLSLPIPRITLALAKLAALWAGDLLVLLAFTLPAGAAYTSSAVVGPWFWPALTAAALLVSLLATAVSVMLGLALTAIAASGRGTLFSNVVGMATLLGVLTLAIAGQSTLFRAFEEDPGVMRARLTASLALFAWVRDAAVAGSASALALLALACLPPAALVSWLVSRWFAPLVGALAVRRGPRHTGELRRSRIRTPFGALVWREARRFFGTSVYFLNTGFGLAILLLGAAWLLVDPSLPDGFEGAARVLGLSPAAMLTLGLMTVAVTVDTTAPSISLEGQRLWILKTSPLPASAVLDAKVAFNLILTVPVLALSATSCALAVRASATDAILLFAVPAAASLFVAELGLVLNLAWPNLSAANDTVVVKQSASVLAALLLGLIGVASAVAAGIMAQTRYGVPALPIMLVVLLALAAALFVLLRTWGVRTFTALY